MPVILLGALGGMASGGILGMFVGATALALGYELSGIGSLPFRTGDTTAKTTARHNSLFTPLN